MAEKRKGKKRKEDACDSLKISSDEYAIAKYLKQHLPNKETFLYTHKVKYFIASKAVDCLLDSKWAMKTKKDTTLFTNRDSVVQYLEILLQHKFFHRAKKVAVYKDAKSTSKKKGKEESSDEKEGKKKKQSGKDDKDKKKDEDEKKRKKKLKLEMHLEQVFCDGSDVYVWIYDPIPMKAWFIGGFVVIGVILLCLFPLWPPSVRQGVYYISIAAAAFLVFILGLAVFRVVVFSILWAATLGKHHLWLLPNLTEDVGFFDSFWPLYKYEYCGYEKKMDPECEEEIAKKNKKRPGCEDDASGLPNEDLVTPASYRDTESEC